ncbi:unnamed protein product [Ectocarpus fasciculatus]
MSCNVCTNDKAACRLFVAWDPPLESTQCQLLPKGSDLSGAGSLAALLATPEVLEAAAVIALLGGTAIWALNFASGAVGALMPSKRESSQEEEEEDRVFK